MQNTLIAIVIIVIIAGGGWWYYSSMQNAPTDGAAGTMLEGSEMEDNGMVGGDAMVDESDTPTGEVKEFKVTGTPMKFDIATMQVKKGDRVRIVFTNGGGMHDWVIDEFNARTKVLNAGDSETIEFVADKTGSFEYYCSVGNHRQMGMKGTLVVTE